MCKSCEGEGELGQCSACRCKDDELSVAERPNLQDVTPRRMTAWCPVNKKREHGCFGKWMARKKWHEKLVCFDFHKGILKFGSVIGNPATIRTASRQNRPGNPTELKVDYTVPLQSCVIELPDPPETGRNAELCLIIRAPMATISNLPGGRMCAPAASRESKIMCLKWFHEDDFNEWYGILWKHCPNCSDMPERPLTGQV